MELVIHGDKIKITDAMKSYLTEKLERLEKYLENSDNVRANIIVKVNGRDQTVEITIPLKSFILRSEETKEDFYAAVDKAIDILERQIRKNKTKLMSRQPKQSYDFNFESIDFEEEKEENQKIVKRKRIEVKPMNEEEAILQMELLGHEFYMFKDADTGKPAVVYRRKDNNYGIIESE